MSVNFAPLSTALEQLLAINERTYGQSGLYNALYRSDLALQGVDIENGTAQIALTGNLQIGGACAARLRPDTLYCAAIRHGRRREHHD